MFEVATFPVEKALDVLALVRGFRKPLWFIVAVVVIVIRFLVFVAVALIMVVTITAGFVLGPLLHCW